jgi:hypothetical protein
MTVNGETLRRGDGVAVSDEGQLTMERRDEAELLLFDLG